MQLGDRQNISESHLIGNAVLDCQGALLGTVTAIKGSLENAFALVVQFSVAKETTDDLTIESPHLKKIDLERQVIYTDLDFNLVVPQRGKSIPLVAEQLSVNRQRRKLGEVVVRKVTETDWVQIPVHREKLVVQTVGQSEPLTEITLGETHLPSGVEFAAAGTQKRDRAAEILGTWPTISAALTTLNHLSTEPTTADLPLTILLFMRDGDRSEPVNMTFPSARLAAQLLPNLAHSWGQQCQEIRLVKPDTNSSNYNDT